ncbi:MAG: VOC family protein [Candidatus Dormibacteria bacterium]|jgi:catechol-2,3-dioxygenase
MPVTRLNHAVLYVRDATRTAAFYREVLDFRVVMEMAGGRAIFLQAPASTNDHDLGLFTVGEGAAASGAGRSTVGLYHIAWEVDTLDELARIQALLTERGALVGATDHGTTKALYARDPDGLEFEVSWLVPAAMITEALQGRMAPLDIAAEKIRFGGSTRGGVGVSIPV